MADTALQRKNMVESQVRPSDITDRRIMRAMLELPREAFVPKGLEALAYADGDVIVWRAPLRAILAARTFAKLVQLAAPEATDSVLDVGSAGGYSAAVLARLAGRVVALEVDKALSEAARAALKAQGIGNVTAITGELVAGHEAGGPYDVIIVEGAVPVIPGALLNQLKDGGRLVALVGSSGLARATLVCRRGSATSEATTFTGAAPVLPGFEPVQGFTF
jgi:protein-L-isoaspartate(D-aspartate) O-methyltransferase